MLKSCQNKEKQPMNENVSQNKSRGDPGPNTLLLYSNACYPTKAQFPPFYMYLMIYRCAL